MCSLNRVSVISILLLLAFGSISTTMPEQVYSPQDVYNIAKDWQYPNNPNGVWSYGIKSYNGSEPTGSFILLDLQMKNVGVHLGEHFFSSTGLGEVWLSTSYPSYFGIPLGWIGINGDFGGISTVRWTAPKTGTVKIYGLVGLGDFGVGFRGIYLNDVKVWSVGYGDTGSFNFTQNVRRGDIIDFLIWGVSGGGGNTPIDATISYVPAKGHADKEQ